MQYIAVEEDIAKSQQWDLNIKYRDTFVQPYSSSIVRNDLVTANKGLQLDKKVEPIKKEKPLKKHLDNSKKENDERNMKSESRNSKQIMQDKKVVKPPLSKDKGAMYRKSYKKEFRYPLEIDLQDLVRQLQAGNKSDIQPINEHNFHFLFSPTEKCNFDTNLTDHKILILVKSAVLNEERRNVIRGTWGTLLPKNMRLVFVLGLPVGGGNLRIRVENSKHGDIVQEDFIDNYRNNTVKMAMAYKWAVTECGSAEYLFFVDDDYFVNVENLQNYFRSGKVRDKRNLFAGTYLGNSVPYRANGSKWYIPWEQYPFDRWPPYIAGGGYFVSMEVARRFHLAFPYVKHMHIDDVFLGITAKKLGIPPKQNREIGYRKQGKISLKRLIACHGYDKRVDVEGAMVYLQQEKEKLLKRNKNIPGNSR